MSDITRLLNIMQALRDPESGCPWDVKQDFRSIAPYTIEEAYEVVDAIQRDDLVDLQDELGDLLLQVVFHSQMASEQGAFSFADVVASISDKMTRRHPHVFGDSKVDNSDDVKVAWEAIKAEEKRQAGNTDNSALAGVTAGLPGLSKAVKLTKKAAKTGFDWPDHEGVIEKIEEELAEVRVEIDAADHQRTEEEIGDLLFAVANLARHVKVDPETALAGANARFESRFRTMEALAEAAHEENGEENGDFPALSLEQQEALWHRAKLLEKNG